VRCRPARRGGLRSPGEPWTWLSSHHGPARVTRGRDLRDGHRLKVGDVGRAPFRADDELGWRDGVQVLGRVASLSSSRVRRARRSPPRRPARRCVSVLPGPEISWLRSGPGGRTGDRRGICPGSAGPNLGQRGPSPERRLGREVMHPVESTRPDVVPPVGLDKGCPTPSGRRDIRTGRPTGRDRERRRRPLSSSPLVVTVWGRRLGPVVPVSPDLGRRNAPGHLAGADVRGPTT